MQSFGNGEDDLFFDSLERLSSGEADWAEPSISGRSRDEPWLIEIWSREPVSVEERRKTFMRQMGFALPESDSEIVDINRANEPRRSLSESPEREESRIMLTESNDDEAELAGIDDVVNSVEGSVEFNGANDLSEGDSPPARKPRKSWWRRVARKSEKTVKQVTTTVKVSPEKKKFLEFTAPYVGQAFAAHRGVVRTMKFSSDGKFLASGGEDGVVRVFRVVSVDASEENLPGRGGFSEKVKREKFGFRRKRDVTASVVFPEKVFRIDETPVREFHGHSGDVLDLAWSDSHSLLSSSVDQTVRLWRLECDESVSVFRHKNYVTCVEFNPVDEGYFISGSIDGKVRVWGVSEKRVVDWADVRDAITAISYRPDGNGFVVGTIAGACRSYRTSGECMLLDSEIFIAGKKRSFGNKITGIKFCSEEPERVMISSEDSKLRVFDGVDLTHKYRGLPKSGSQSSASLAPGDRHIVSVGDDSRVYIWNYDGASSAYSPKTVRSCENFPCEAVSVAVPWSAPRPATRDGSDRFSLGGWFSGEGAGKGSATWPEEKLPEAGVAVSETWGLVIVTAGSDGMIRTFHNYGLPLRL